MTAYIDYSVKLALSSYIFYIIMLVLASPYKNYFSETRGCSSNKIWLFFICYILLNVFSFWEYDTYHTWEHFTYSNGFELYGYEDIYSKIAGYSNGNYFIWRTIVWLPACLFIYLTAKELDLLNNKILLSIVLFGSFIGYSRGMLGFTMLVYGATLAKEHTNKLSVVIGLVLVAFSYYFHKSMYVAILFATISLIPLRKSHIKFLLYLFPVLASFTTVMINRYGGFFSALDLSSGVGEVGQGAMESVLSSEKLIRNTTGQIMKIIEITPQYLTLLYMGTLIYKYNVFKLSNHQYSYEYLFRFTFVGFYIASLFYFTDYSSWLYERFKHMAFFPMIIVLGATLQYDGKQIKWMRYIVVYQLAFTIFTHILRIYSNL